MGSIGVASWIALAAFPTLIVIGLARGELSPKSAIVWAGVGLLVWLGLPRIVSSGSYLVTSALAILDIALVLVVFKGDVRIG
jgi:hypothetical protein